MSLAAALAPFNFTADCTYDGCKFHQREVAAVSSILLVISTTAFTLRMVARHLVKSAFALDDWLSFGALLTSAGCNGILLGGLQHGFGMHDVEIGPLNIRELLQGTYALELLWVASLCMAKWSLLFFYCRLFPEKRLRRFCYGIAWAIGGFIIAAYVTLIFQCQPVNFYWQRALQMFEPSIQGKCTVNVVVFYAISSVFNMITDILVFLLPLPIIWRLNISLKKKIGLTFAFTVGIFVSAVSIIRLTLLHALKPADVAWDQVGVGLWACTEASGATIDSCIPTLTPVVLRLLGHRVSPSSGSSGSGLKYKRDMFGSHNADLYATRGLSAVADRKGAEGTDEETLASPLSKGELHPNHGAPALSTRSTTPSRLGIRPDSRTAMFAKGLKKSITNPARAHRREDSSREEDQYPLAGLGDIEVRTEMQQTEERRPDNRRTLAGVVNIDISASRKPILWRGINSSPSRGTYGQA